MAEVEKVTIPFGKSERESAWERYKHNMAVHARGGSPDEYIKPPRVEPAITLSDFSESPDFARGMAKLYADTALEDFSDEQ